MEIVLEITSKDTKLLEITSCWGRITQVVMETNFFSSPFRGVFSIVQRANSRLNFPVKFAILNLLKQIKHQHINFNVSRLSPEILAIQNTGIVAEKIYPYCV